MTFCISKVYCKAKYYVHWGYNVWKTEHYFVDDAISNVFGPKEFDRLKISKIQRQVPGTLTRVEVFLWGLLWLDLSAPGGRGAAMVQFVRCHKVGGKWTFTEEGPLHIQHHYHHHQFVSCNKMWGKWLGTRKTTTSIATTTNLQVAIKCEE